LLINQTGQRLDSKPVQPVAFEGAPLIEFRLIQIEARQKFALAQVCNALQPFPGAIGQRNFQKCDIHRYDVRIERDRAVS